MLIDFFSEIVEGRDRQREKKNQFERETSISCLSYIPRPGTNKQPRHVPSLGVEHTTFQFME